jgi:hypothetical protein
MRRVVAVAACLLLGGCATQKLEEEMVPGLVGQPLDAVIAKLGVPAEERSIAAQKVYIWVRSQVDEGTLTKCQIRVIMSGDVIGSVGVEGNQVQCRRYADLLSR